MNPRPSALFLFSPSLYDKTPLAEKWAFLHGMIVESKTRNGELSVRGKDEKGEWEAYYATPPGIRSFSTGTRVWVYGQILLQPDGRTQLAAQWVKEVNEKEMNDIIQRTHTMWEKIVNEFPTLNEIKPKERIIAPIQSPSSKAFSPPLESEFVSASEFKIERDYV